MFHWKNYCTTWQQDSWLPMTLIMQRYGSVACNLLMDMYLDNPSIIGNRSWKHLWGPKSNLVKILFSVSYIFNTISWQFCRSWQLRFCGTCTIVTWSHTSFTSSNFMFFYKIWIMNSWTLCEMIWMNTLWHSNFTWPNGYGRLWKHSTESRKPTNLITKHN